MSYRTPKHSTLFVASIIFVPFCAFASPQGHTNTDSNPELSKMPALIQQDASFKTLLVAPSEKVKLVASSNLKVGNGLTDNQWFALFGTITPDGRSYTAPHAVPPKGLDWIFLVPGNSQQAAKIDLLVTVAEKRKLSINSGAIEPIKKEKLTKSLGGGKGYKLPITLWSDAIHEADVVIPASDSLHVPEICTYPGPVNPLPTTPVGNADIDVESGWLTVSTPQDWTPYQQTLIFDTKRVALIKKLYGVDVPEGDRQTTGKIRRADLFRVNYVDHYRRSLAGDRWIFVNTIAHLQRGESKEADPQWLILFEIPYASETNHDPTNWYPETIETIPQSGLGS